MPLKPYSRHATQSPSWKRGVVSGCILIILIGVSCRLINLDQKPYWMDETYTLLRASGYSAAEVRRQAFDGQVTTVAEFQKFQRPSLEKGAFGTIAGLAAEEPQHPPLYFLLTRCWEQLFGSSKAATRSLPAIFSLLTFPVIYWLCLELLHAPITGWVAMAFYAVSPIFLQQAQSARQYSLWTLLMLIASATLLRGIAQPSKRIWTIYIGATILGFYTHLLTGTVLIAHGLYLLLFQGFQFTRTLRYFMISAGTSLSAISPWLWLAWNNQDIAIQTTQWMTRPISHGDLIRAWGRSLTLGFGAWHYQYEHLLSYLSIPITLFLGYAIYHFWHSTAPRTWSFLLLLLGTSFLPFLVADLLLGGGRSTSNRYFLLCYISIDIIIAHFFTSKLHPEIGHAPSRLWALVMILLLSTGAVSCINGALGKTWWGWSEFDVEIPPIVHQVSRPLVISDLSFYESFRFAHQFNPDVHLLFPRMPEEDFRVPDGFQHIFLFAPSDKFLSIIQQQSLNPRLVYQFADASTQFTLSLYRIELHDLPITPKS
ncbi:glycosyltransferase family 39 protein [Synechococcus sp. CCY9201]|uniref:glycosyltransferase family 39 protein n=1 Tax=Synechococcus sp. CCY9201 TaxID=174697 RepID=UPI002B1F03C1|nr:glycosyltransferase family 39 protein [Synechococcus sp. CCY9201]MEA5473058.1 glycosyltransferase family 39 protein [Synechococcus sp. CCY9201]